MNFRQFAFNNVFRNKRTYVAHFLSSAFSVMIFFTYAMLAFHPDLKGQIMADSITLSILATMGMHISQVVIFVFSFLFLLYSVGSFIKVRKREFGILLLLGMSRKQLNRMLFIENVLIGVAAIVTGILVGIVFSKLILLICASMLVIERGLPFYPLSQSDWADRGRLSGSVHGRCGLHVAYDQKRHAGGPHQIRG